MGMVVSSMYDRIWERRRGHCPSCKLGVSMGRRDTRRIWPEITDNIATQSGDILEHVWTCEHCGKSIVEFELMLGGGKSTTFDIWPPRSPRALDEHAPDVVRGLYAEASKCEFAKALRGAAALYRATVEEICKDLGATGGTLKAKIEELRSKGVEGAVVDGLDEARLLGNWSVHDAVEFDPAEVEDVAELISDAADNVYGEPARRAAMKASREARRAASGTSTDK
jgi:hypothetical protein